MKPISKTMHSLQAQRSERRAEGGRRFGDSTAARRVAGWPTLPGACQLQLSRLGWILSY